MLSFKRRINFYETDLMEIMHHSNYLRLFEEARLHWCRVTGIHQWHGRDKEFLLAVTRTEVMHKAPVAFDEEVELRVQARQLGIRLQFSYLLIRGDGKTISAQAITEHVLVNNQLKPLRIPKKVLEILENQKWIEI